MAITRAQQARQMYKKGSKPVVQGGVENYLGKQPQVVAPRKWQSSPDAPPTELAYITKAEKDLILKKDIHGSLDKGPNMGPSGIMSLDSFGDIGGGQAGSEVDSGRDEDRAEKTTFSNVREGPGSYESRIFSPADKKLAEQRLQTIIDNQEKDMPEKKSFFDTIKGFVPPTRKLLYGALPNDPKSELRYLANLKFNNPAAFAELPKNLRDLYEETEDSANEFMSYKDFPKFSFDDFEDLRNFQPTDGLNFAEYAAKYEGAPGLLYSGDVGGLIKIKNPDGTFRYERRSDDNGGGISDLEARLRSLEQQKTAASGSGSTDTEKIASAFQPNFRLLAEGGRAGFQEGGGIEQRLEKLGGDVSSAEQMLQGINQRLKTAESSLGSGGGIGGLLGAGGPKIDEAFNPMQTPPGSMPVAGPPNFDTAFGGAFKGLDMSGFKPVLSAQQDMVNFSINGNEVQGMNSAFVGSLKKYLDSTGQGDAFSIPGFTPLGQAQAVQQARPGLLPNTRPMGIAAADGTMSLISNPLSPQQQMEQANAAAEKSTPEERVQGAYMTLANRAKKSDKELAYLDRIIKSGGTDYLLDLDYFTNPGLRAGGGGSLGIPAAGYADGGNVVGGEYDFESARQMYGLGKLVKKVTRSVKKIAKSPLGKLALGAAAFKFGPAFLSGQGFGLGTAKKFSDLKFLGEGANVNLFRAIGIPSILAGLTAETDDENQEQYVGADLPFPVDYYLSGQYAPNMRLAAEGGLMRQNYDEAGAVMSEKEMKKLAKSPLYKGFKMMYGVDPNMAKENEKYEGKFEQFEQLFKKGYQKGGDVEPVAKKTMPLLDMGGMEKDYREEGGFVPIGRMEKADDVPARLSKNEFVFTAEAVRNAGDGDVDLGAEKMYNMMKNLEAGGDVSEESQGMDGARKMFQTSQRLEEVI